jgi:hypothetical protein
MVLQALDRRAKTLGDVGKYTLDLPAFGRVRNQGSLNACCAYAGVSLMEYRVRRDRGPSDPDCSVGFLYKVTRDLMKKDDADSGKRNFDGNAPVDSRTTMKAMTMIGVAPEKMFVTSEADLDVEPDALTYALAGNFRATSYWRVDTKGVEGADLLTEVKRMIRGDYPLMFTVRFLVQTSLFDFAKRTAKLRQLPVPPVDRIRAYKTYETVGALLAPGKNSGLVSASAGAAPIHTQTRAQATMAELQKVLGLAPAAGGGRTPRARRARGAAAPKDQLVGHALVACGFDDSRGCLLVRNSWSDEWGRAAGRPGYGWLPYEYVTEGLTEDWWFISDVSFLDPAIFGALPAAPAA